MPVDQPVVVAVDAGADVCDVRRLTVDVPALAVADELHELSADVEPVDVVPVVVDRRRGSVRRRPGLAGVHDEPETEHDDERHDDGKEGAALESDLLSLALLGQARSLFGR